MFNNSNVERCLFKNFTTRNPTGPGSRAGGALDLSDQVRGALPPQWRARGSRGEEEGNLQVSRVATRGLRSGRQAAKTVFYLFI